MIEKKETESWEQSFLKDSNPDPSTFGYIPLETNVPGENTGSVYLAHLRQENTIGSALNRLTYHQLDENVREDYNFSNYVNRIPRDLILYADRFFGATTDEDFQSIEAQIRQEIADKSLLAANPIKSLVYAFDPLEPTNWLPGSVAFKGAKTGSRVARSMMGVGIAAAASTGIQEAILHQNQLTRTMQESIFNTMGAGIVGGVLGGGVAAFAGRKAGFNAEDLATRQRIENEVNETINPSGDLSAAKNAIMDDNEIARMPKYIAKTMRLTSMNRLFNSPFKTAKWFASAAYEHGYELQKNSAGIANEKSMEQAIKDEMRALGKKQIDHMNYYYEMHGVEGKYFRETRKKLGELGTESPLNLNLDQFNRAVYEVALTGSEHAIPQVNKAAAMWRNEFDRIGKVAIDEGLLPEDVTVPNAPNYIMIAYNKNKIIEEGGKAARGDGTFAQHLFDQFEASNEATKQFLESPFYAETTNKLKELRKLELMYPKEQLENFAKKLALTDKKIASFKRDIKRFSKSETPDIKSINKFKKEIKALESDKEQLKSSIESHNSETARIAKEIEELEKSILDQAPSNAKTWEGKLHNVIEGDGIQSTEDFIWDQVGQTIDHILGDSDGKLLNPFLSKLGGATRPFKARKLIIDQLQASPWHITDIQKIAEMHNRAMVPAIEMQKFAKKNGFKDINDFLLGMGDLIKKEFEVASAGKTGKEAQKIRAQYDEAIEDMQATIQMLQGVYGQGFNVLNSKGAEFFNNIMNWNYTRMLGHMTLSSLPDLGRLVMKNPLMDVIAQGIGDSFSVVKKISKNDLRALGYGIETESASIFKSYIEHQGLSTTPGPFTKGLNSLTRHFGNLSLMNPWQDMVTNISGHIAINRMLNIVHKAVEGKATKKELTLAARLGIGSEHFETIAKHTKDNIYKGTRYADWTNWEIKTAQDSEALKSFQSAITKSIDEIIIIPKLGDKPLFMQQKGTWGNLSKLMFQFKSYMLAATNRIFYAGVQNRNDINMYLGAVAMMGMGMLGYVASSVFRGSEDQLDLSPINLILEGVDRSGVLGIFGEMISLGRKQLQLGEVSRYKSRDAFGSVLGPTGGSASELISLFNKINPVSSAKGEVTTKDASIIMKLMPMQNVFYFQRINRKLFHRMAESLGATVVND